MSVIVKTLLEPWLVKNCAWSLTRFIIDVARKSDFRRQCNKYCVGKSLGETSCSRRKADGMFLGKLYLSHKKIVGVGQMRTTADIVCYSGVICACEKGENLGSSSVLSKKTNMCSIPRDQIVLNAKISASEKSMSWIMALQLLSQMQDTEVQLTTYHHCVEITVSGKASQAKECDEHVSDVTMDNVTMNACEKVDQWSIELRRETTTTSIL